MLFGNNWESTELHFRLVGSAPVFLFLLEMRGRRGCLSERFFQSFEESVSGSYRKGCGAR